MAAAARPKAALSVGDGVVLLIGVVIGIGIFKAPSLVAQNVGSEFAFVGAWVLGALVTLVGALCYAELGSAHPNAGGEYHFLSRAYGQPVGLLFAWARGSVIQTGAIAGVAFVYGDYASVLLPLGTKSVALHAALAVVALTLVNLAGLGLTRGAQWTLSGLTVLALAVVIAAGFLTEPTIARPEPSAAPPFGAIGLAMVFVLLTYGGWNEAAYLSGELKDVRRNLPRVFLIATVLIALLYLLANLAYLRVFGLEGLRRSEAVGADLMRLAAGDAGAILLSLAVVCTALSTLNGTIFTGARTYYALGRDLAELKLLGRWEVHGDKPANALILQCAIALVLVVFGAFARDGFEAMVLYTAPVFWFFLLLVGISLFVFRWREPNRALPYRVPLYPLTPIVFCLASAWMLYSAVAYTGYGSLVGIGVLLLGLPLAWLGHRRAPKRA